MCLLKVIFGRKTSSETSLVNYQELKSFITKIPMKIEDCCSSLPESFKIFVCNTLKERDTLLERNKTLYSSIFTLESDLMVCVLVYIFSENGFTTNQIETRQFVSYDRKVLQDLKNLPLSWRDNNNLCYNLTFFFPLLVNHSFHVMAVPSCDALIVNVITKHYEEVEETSSLVIRPNKYLSPLNSKLEDKFKNLKELSNILNDKIIYLRDKYLNMSGVANPSLLGIPTEILIKIIILLPLDSFLLLTSSCKNLYSLAKDSNIWRIYLERDFKQRETKGDPFEKYKDLFKKRRVLLEESEDQFSDSVLLDDDLDFQYLSFSNEIPS